MQVEQLEYSMAMHRAARFDNTKPQQFVAFSRIGSPCSGENLVGRGPTSASCGRSGCKPALDLF